MVRKLSLGFKLREQASHCIKVLFLNPIDTRNSAVDLAKYDKVLSCVNTIFFRRDSETSSSQSISTEPGRLYWVIKVNLTPSNARTTSTI